MNGFLRIIRVWITLPIILYIFIYKLLIWLDKEIWG
jgi:hypothetical protein